MIYRLLIKEPAKRQIDRLDPAVRSRIHGALKRIATMPTIGKPLRKPLDGLWSYRSGDWRIVYEVHSRAITVIVVAVGHRREIYDAIRRALDRL